MKYMSTEMKYKSSLVVWSNDELPVMKPSTQKRKKNSRTRKKNG